MPNRRFEICACGYRAKVMLQRKDEIYICRGCKHMAGLRLLVRVFGPGVLRLEGRRAMAKTLEISDVTARNWLRGVTVIRADNLSAIIDVAVKRGKADADTRLNIWRILHHRLRPARTDWRARRDIKIVWNVRRDTIRLPEFVTPAQIEEYLKAEGYQ